jgi:hypothetical protein
MKKHVLMVSWASVFGAAALAQSTLLSIDGKAPDEGFGAAVAGPGDVDGDGVPDLAVGVPGGAVGGAKPGVLRLLSGLDGSLIWEARGAPTQQYFGAALAAMDDIDGDGVGELLVRGSAPGLKVLSGRTGTLVWGYGGHPFSAMGASFAGLDDLDGDGVSDFAIGEPIIKQSLTVMSGATGAQLHQWAYGLGFSVARSDDLDGDGVGDVLAGWYDSDGVLPSKAIAYSGSTKQVLFEIPAPPDAVSWAAELAADADLDGDGLPELALADPLFDAGRGRVTVLRGSDLGVHFEVIGTPGLRLGFEIAYCGDVDGDGIDDLLCGNDAQPAIAAAARVHSGATGALVLDVQGPPDQGYGRAVAALGDLDDDGANDIAIGWYGATTAAGEVGRVLAIAGPCPTPVAYCTAQVNSQGCVSELSWSGSPLGLSGAPFLLAGSKLIPGATGIVIYSLGGPNSTPVLGGTLCVLPPFKRTPPALKSGSGACGGVLTFDFGAWVQSGADPSLVPGTALWAQIWSRDPQAASGSNLTGGLAIQLGS